MLRAGHGMGADVTLERNVACPQRVQDTGLHRSNIGHRRRVVGPQRVADHIRDRCRWNRNDDHTHISCAWRLDNTRAQAGGNACVADLVIPQVHPIARSREGATDRGADEPGPDDDGDLGLPGDAVGSLVGGS